MAIGQAERERDVEPGRDAAPGEIVEEAVARHSVKHLHLEAVFRHTHSRDDLVHEPRHVGVVVGSRTRRSDHAAGVLRRTRASAPS